jgi:tetratricopeptide (TPR) repeat protein
METADVTEADPFERARLLYERAVFGGDDSGLADAGPLLDAVEADLALARGRIMHATFLAERQEDPRELALFERAAELYQQLGKGQGEGEALFWVGAFHQVVRGDNPAALPALQRSYELAATAGDKLTLSYAARHLGFADLAAGRVESARGRLEESVALRRQIAFLPGVAAGLLALAHLTARQGDRGKALALLDEAATAATGSGARGTLRWIEQARAELLAGCRPARLVPGADDYDTLPRSASLVPGGIGRQG